MNFYTEANLVIKILCFIIFTVISLSAYSQLNAKFTVSVQQGCGPLSVQFTDASSGNPTQWEWNLGNGAISDDQDPGAIYLTPGKYTITLTVTNASGQSSITKTDFITVNPNPSVSFSATPLEGCAPLNVSFFDKSIPGTGTIINRIWDFGDGTTSDLQNPSHTYNVSDTFDVTLGVTNSAGCKQIIQNKGLIKIAGLVKAGFSYNYTNVCKPPATVSFTNSSSANPPVNYQWFFGDGSGSATVNPTHVYTTAGNFTVKLIARNHEGCSDTTEQIIAVGSAKANFTYSAACVNDPVIFSDASSPKPLSETWDFGDGTTQDGDVVSHTYSGSGIFPVTLTANFGNCTDVIKKTIVTGQKPTAGFIVTGNANTCNYPETLHFHNTSAGAVSYDWDFGDGATGDTSANPDHTYEHAGKYSVTLIAINAIGCADTLIQYNIIRLGPPHILSIDSVPFEGCAPRTVVFRPELIAPEPITYKWTFGDGTTSTDSVPKHTYTKVGSYTVKLVITTIAKGCQDSITVTDAVLAGNRPKANFSALPLQSCAGNNIQFTDSSKGSITNWQWFFGDEGSSSAQNPLYIYKDTGYYSVTLVVSEYGCFDTFVRKNYVYLKPPVAIFNYENQCADPLQYNFHDKSKSPQTWLWHFGDGSSSKDSSPIHTYAAAGIYPISLTVTNDGCTYINHDTLTVVDEQPSFAYKSLKSNFCKYDSVEFYATNFTPENIKTFYWDFGDSTSAGFDSSLDTVYHAYTISGAYEPYLIVENINGCLDTVQTNMNVNIYGPAAAFSNKNGNCINDNIIFNDESHSDGKHAIKEWIWNYGDSSKPDTLLGSPFMHKYSLTGTYIVSLKVTDEGGCYDTITNIDAVNVTHPVAAFTSDTLSCTGNILQFSDSSIGISDTYKWDFGDGNASSDVNPQHAYTTEGSYNVKLIAIDKNGCTDTLLKPAYILVINPAALFSLTDTLFTCPPAFIQPQSLSKNFQSLLWDFGDGNTSSELNPNHYYTTSGNYILTLTVQGYGASCINKFSKNIVLKGPLAKLKYNPFSGCNPLNASFSASAKNTVTYIWDFGDGGINTTTDSLQQYTYTSTGKFLPQLILVDSGGCRVSVVNNDTIVVYGSDAKFGIDQSLSGCDSLNINFIDSSTALLDNIKTYSWKFDDGNSSFVRNPAHTYLKSGLYNPQLTISTEKGCVSDYTLPLNINVVPAPIINAVIPDSACVSSSLILNAAINNNVPGISWQWYLGNGDSALVQNPAYTYSSAGKFPVKVIATGLTGCADTVQQFITINPLPVIHAGNEATVCLGKGITLSPSGGQSYNWLQNASLSCSDCTNPIATPMQTTQYYVSGTNSFGCLSTDSVMVYVVQPSKILLSNNDSICAGSQVQLSASGEDVYNWQPANLVSPVTGAQTTSTPAVTTIYTVVGSDSRGCFSDTAFATVHVFPYPKVQIADSLVTIEGGTDYKINATGSEDIVSWQWAPVNWLSCTDCAQPVTSPKSTITYTVKAQNIAGCASEKSITITVICKDQNLYIPNTFSPNNDGMNDYFYPRGKGFAVKSFRIFSRWGNLVFEQNNFVPNNQSYGWNGTYKGSVLQPDVYVYMIEVLCDNGNIITTKGNVTLLR